MSTHIVALPISQQGVMANISSAQNIHSDTEYSIWLLRDDESSLEALTSNASLIISTLKLPDVLVPQSIAQPSQAVELDALMVQALSLDTALGQIGGG